MRGNFWGQGLGNGVKKLGALPEVHSDFLFASLGEEAGFFGIFFVLVLFLLLAIRGYYIALGCRDRFSYYLGFGLTSSILYQAFFNMAVVAGLVPATGIPLPFFSAGGSSLLVTFIMCGLLQNIYRNQEVREGEAAEGLRLFPDQSWMTQGWTYEGARNSGDPLRFRVDPSLLEGRGE
jgi:cell division protein FtsW